MDRFIQLHLLTGYPPSNLNRDDLGRPKTAVMGGATRLRISSQSLKRAWRTSEIFESALKENLGTRTKEMGIAIYEKLISGGIDHKKAMEWAKKIAGAFGKSKTLSKKEKNELKELKGDAKLKLEQRELEIEQLAHFGPAEEEAITELIDIMIERNDGPIEEELGLLREQSGAADIALFGRMLASNHAFGVEAAAQIAHAVTVNQAAVEDDFFTAVDDLNRGEDLGAGHMGETEFGSGLFYLYLCINRELLLENLGGDKALARRAVAALVEASATIAPGGKQSSFASRARASFIAGEKGNQQPRSLSIAFFEPVRGQQLVPDAIEQFRKTREKMNSVYGDYPSDADSGHYYEMNAYTGTGSLKDLINFAAE